MRKIVAGFFVALVAACGDSDGGALDDSDGAPNPDDSDGAPNPSCTGFDIVATSGSNAEGDELVVSGCGFGEKDLAPPLFFDTVDETWTRGEPLSPHPYDSIGDGDIIPCGAGHPFEGEGAVCNKNDIMKMAEDEPHYGVRSRHYIGPFQGVQAWLQTPAGFPDPTMGEIDRVYLRWYFKPSFDTQEVGGSDKFVRVWDTRGPRSIGIQVSWTQMHLTYNGGGPSWHKDETRPGEWNRLELYIDSKAGVIRAWTNGELIHDITDFIPAPGFQGIQPRLWGFDGNPQASSLVGETIELTDYWADQTLARVEIGDAPTWDECTVREPQPALSWNEGEIRVRVNQGALGSLSGRYLYVVTDDGTVSESIEIP